MGTQDKRPTGTLTVWCTPASRSTGVQIEIRKPNLALVGITSPARSITVAEGKYHVRGLSQSGEELFGEIEVLPNQHVDLLLQPDADDIEAVFRPTAGPVAFALPQRRSSDVEVLGSTPATLGVRTFSGNVLRNECHETDSPALTEASTTSSDTRLFHLQPGNTTAVQLHIGGKPVNLVPPISPQRGCTLEVTKARGETRCQFILDGEAGTFLTAYALGQLDAAAAATHAAFSNQASAMHLAEDLLVDKLEDPVGAILSGLGLLRMGELEMLSDWTGKLQRALIWSPDAVCIRGEHLARTGFHREALEAFLDLPARGLPMFSDSLSYALNRLRTYLRVGDWGERRSDRADLVTRLQRFSAVSRLKSPFVSYVGLDPNQPTIEASVV